MHEHSTGAKHTAKDGPTTKDEQNNDPADLAVVSCFYNRQPYLDDLLETLDAQTLQPAQIIIVDDGSTPPLVCPQRPNLTLVRLEKNSGPAAARNRGVEATKCGIIAFLDSDDRWHKDKLARQYGELARAASSVFGVLCDYRRTGRKLRANLVRTPMTDDWFSYFLMGIRCGPGSTLMFRREIFMSLGGFNEKFRRYEDWDFLLRVARSPQCRFLTINQPLAEVELTGRPDPAMTMRALDEIETIHLPGLKNPAHRRLFASALNIERAAVSRWGKQYGKMFLYLLKALTSPKTIKRELDLTLNRY